ncbi:hypothetical protein [Ensifer sp. SL37]|nr:hypothetical protein [Ensifer sp. SL37]MCY1740644.1 hypothetical protein [Ensifer sp. SL37]
MKKFFLMAAATCALSVAATDVVLADVEICIGDGVAEVCLISPE